MDRQRYIPGDQILHPGTGRTEYYQDTNGVTFRETRHDAHGNKFTTSYALDPATRYGYSGPGGPPQSPYGTDPAQQYGYTVLGVQLPRRRQVPAAPGWGPAAPTSYGRDLGARVSAATGTMYRNAEPSGADGTVLVLFLALALLFAVLPLGIAFLVYKAARRRGRDARQTVITIGLAEPTWALLLWHWMAHQAWWPAMVALVLPTGYAALARWHRG